MMKLMMKNWKYGCALLLAMVAVLTVQAGSGRKSVANRLNEYGKGARDRLTPAFKRARITYPPAQLVLVGLKEEQRLQVYAKSGTNGFTFIREYPILAASGIAGPKLQEGDGQVPEGIYAIESLNPNSSYHLSLRVSYPNAFDRTQALKDKRTNLGGDIMIHGKAASIGCLAMGDVAAEDLFVLAADTGLKNITVILSPLDFRSRRKLPEKLLLPAWVGALHQEIKKQLATLPAPKKE